MTLFETQPDWQNHLQPTHGPVEDFVASPRFEVAGLHTAFARRLDQCAIGVCGALSQKATQATPWVTNRQLCFTLGNHLPDCNNPSLPSMTLAAHELSDWGEMPQRPGLYLSMSHGREFPLQIMRGRGFAGPKIGPLLYVKTTYGQEVTLRFASLRDAKRFFPDALDKMPKLQILEGTLVHDGKCYGDWDVCFIDALFCLKNKQ